MVRCPWHLTVKLRGRPEAPIKRRGHTLSPYARGDTTGVHGPLQRLLERNLLIRSQTSLTIGEVVLFTPNARARKKLP